MALVCRCVHGLPFHCGILLVQEVFSRQALIVGASPPVEPVYSRGLYYLHQSRDLFTECGAAIDLEWVERILARPELGSAGVQ